MKPERATDSGRLPPVLSTDAAKTDHSLRVNRSILVSPIGRQRRIAPSHANSRLTELTAAIELDGRRSILTLRAPDF
jgi:hypothetical protein